MPIYEFECKAGHKHECFMSYEDSLHQWFCTRKVGWIDELNIAKLCNEPMEKIWSAPARIQIGKPTIVFTNPQTGEARIAVHEHEQAPAGFTRTELKSSIERSAFEHQQNAIAAHQDDVYNEMIVQKREDARRQIIDNAKAHASDDASISDNPSATKSLMDAAIKHVRSKPTQKRKRKTEFRFDVNHLDKSNL